MRISDFSDLSWSSIVFHRPAGEVCACAIEAPRARPIAATNEKLCWIIVSSFDVVLSSEASEQRFVHLDQRRVAGASGADQAGRLGQELREVKARRRQLGLVERIARIDLGE